MNKSELLEKKRSGLRICFDRRWSRSCILPVLSLGLFKSTCPCLCSWHLPSHHGQHAGQCVIPWISPLSQPRPSHTLTCGKPKPEHESTIGSAGFGIMDSWTHEWAHLRPEDHSGTHELVRKCHQVWAHCYLKKASWYTWTFNGLKS